MEIKFIMLDFSMLVSIGHYICVIYVCVRVYLFMYVHRTFVIVCYD